MAARRRDGILTGAALAQAAILAGLTACAIPMAPPGGPVDRTPPTLASAWPESGATEIGEAREISLLFSEKMTPVAAESFVRLYPPREFAKTRWKGRREARIELEEPLPADTVFVLEVTGALKDAHGVAAKGSRRWPFATGDRLPDGALSGLLVLEGKPLVGGVVELFPVPPDTLEFFQQPVLRRTVTDSLGAFTLPWLPVPGGPWLLRAFADGNGDLHPGEQEAQRLLPRGLLDRRAGGDSLAAPTLSERIARQREPAQVALDSTHRRRTLGLTELFPPGRPGVLLGRLDSLLAWNGPVRAWPMTISEEDTGWTPAPQERVPRNLQDVPRDSLAAIREAGPGLVRLVLFVDADGDSLLSALPAAAGRDTAPWFLEPFVVLDSLEVDPGLESAFPPPLFPVTLSPWSPPEHAGGEEGRPAAR
jgi:hypothetical protein